MISFIPEETVILPFTETFPVRFTVSSSVIVVAFQGPDVGSAASALTVPAAMARAMVKIEINALLEQLLKSK